MAEFDPDAFLARSEKREKKSTGFDPDAFLKKTEPETPLQTFGRSSASLADSLLNTITGTLDYGAYALARAAGRSPEQATAETTSPKDVVGRAFGVTGTPGYENAPVRTAGNVIGQAIGENVVQPIAGATGLPEADVANMVNTGMIAAGPAVPKVAGAVKPVVAGAVDTAKGLGTIAASPLETAKGVASGFTGTAKTPTGPVKPWETASARMPIGETYIPAPVLEAYRAGQITAEQARDAARPTSTLPVDALKRTQGMVPFKGQEARAAGEHFGAGYRDPYKAALEIGGDVLLGGLPSAARLAYKGYDIGRTAQAYNQLGKAGFSPLTPGEAAALGGRGGPSGPVAPGGGGGMPFPVPNTPPMLPYSPAGQSPMPMGGPQRAVNIEGNRSVLPYNIDVSNSQTARPGPMPQPVAGTVAPAAIAQQAAVEKITPPATPVQAAAQETVAQKAQRVMGNKYRAPKTEQPVAEPVAGPVAPVELPPAPVAAPVVETPVSTPTVKTTKKAPALKLDDKTTNLTDQQLKQIFKSEGIEADKTTIHQAILEKHRMSFPKDWKEQLSQKTVAEVKQQAKLYKEALDGEKAFSNMFESKGYSKPNFWQLSDVLGNDITKGNRGFNDIARMPKEELSKRIDAYIAKNKGSKTFNAEDIAKQESMPGTMEMKTNPQTTFKNKAAYEEQRFNDKLAGEPTLGSYIDNGKLYEFELNRDYAGTPKELQKHMGPEVRERVTDLATGKIIKGEPRALTMREKLEAAKKKKGK